MPLVGGTNYKLDVPAANFWSVPLSEAENASGLANGQPFPSLGSRDMPVQNADGSTDLFLIPEAPEGHDTNWLATVPGSGYVAIMRLHGPTEPALTKTWKPGDATKLKRRAIIYAPKSRHEMIEYLAKVRATLVIS